MSIELLDAVLSLGMVLDEENDRLAAPGYDVLLPELVAAKTRLVGRIEAENVRLQGDGRDWRADLDPDAEIVLRDTVAELLDKLAINQGLLSRRIALCDDLLGAITAEAKRAAGGRSLVYGARGGLAQVDQATPIAINSRL